MILIKKVADFIGAFFLSVVMFLYSLWMFKYTYENSTQLEDILPTIFKFIGITIVVIFSILIAIGLLIRFVSKFNSHESPTPLDIVPETQPQAILSDILPGRGGGIIDMTIERNQDDNDDFELTPIYLNKPVVDKDLNTDKTNAWLHTDRRKQLMIEVSAAEKEKLKKKIKPRKGLEAEDEDAQ